MKLKILILIDWFLPGNKAGGPVKSIYSLIKALHNQIDFFVVTMNTDISSNKIYAVPSDTWTYYENIPIYYFSKEKFSMKKLKQVISEINPHVIYINSFWSVKFSIIPLLLKKFKQIQVPIVLAPRGMLDHGAMHIKSFKKNIFIKLTRWISLHKDIIFHATSPSEKIKIQQYYPHANIFLVSNLSYLHTSSSSYIVKEKNTLKLFFLSRVSAVKNLDFAIKVLSHLPLPEDAHIEYDIYGNNEDKEYFKYCKSLSQSLPKNIHYTYKGTLSFEEVSRVISQYHFLFLPTKNENFGHAIVETLMCRRPVIISDCTPWNAVNEHQCGYALPLKEEIFIEKLLDALNMNDTVFQQMCANAKNFIHTQLQTHSIQQEYLKMFEYVSTRK